MATVREVTIPDIGDVDEVDVIEMAVAAGDEVEVDQALITLESDKATMDVPAPFSGVITELKIGVGDKVSQGSLIAYIEPKQSAEKTTDPAPGVVATGVQSAVPVSNGSSIASKGTVVDIIVPDMGDVDKASIIEIPVAVGDELALDDTVVVLESEKASMDIPATSEGKVVEVLVETGSTVSVGMPLLRVESKPVATAIVAQTASETRTEVSKTPAVSSEPPRRESKPAPVPDHPGGRPPLKGNNEVIHATPAVRRFARELGADLTKITGTGRKKRILKSDVQSYIKYELSRPKVTSTNTGGAMMPEMPAIDFTKFGDVEEVPLTRIQKVSSVALHRNWVVIPHVTQHDEVDITELESFRKSMKTEAEREGVRLTTLGFIMKAVVKALKEYPKFNASLSADGETVILKKYFHVGVAVETPDGLVVPVIRDVDKKTIFDLAGELAEVSKAARDKKLTADRMKGSCFTISSLGGIGGTAFTPIVNWPDVAILGVSRHQTRPAWNGKEFEPKLMLPLSLSYDHRVIDGADAARFIVFLGKILEDIRRILL